MTSEREETGKRGNSKRNRLLACGSTNDPENWGETAPKAVLRTRKVSKGLI